MWCLCLVEGYAPCSMHNPQRANMWHTKHHKLHILFFLAVTTWTRQVHTIECTQHMISLFGITSIPSSYHWMYTVIMSCTKIQEYKITKIQKYKNTWIHKYTNTCYDVSVRQSSREQRLDMWHVYCAVGWCIQQLGIVSVIWGKGCKKGSLTIICDICESPWWRYQS